MSDPFATKFDVGLPPEGRFWQWINVEDLEDFQQRGWRAVEPRQEVCGSILVENDLFTIEQRKQAFEQKAEQNVVDCLAEMGQIVKDAGHEFIGAGAMITQGAIDGEAAEQEVGLIGQGASEGSGEPSEAAGVGSEPVDGHGSVGAGGDAGIGTDTSQQPVADTVKRPHLAKAKR